MCIRPSQTASTLSRRGARRRDGAPQIPPTSYRGRDDRSYKELHSSPSPQPSPGVRRSGKYSKSESWRSSSTPEGAVGGDAAGAPGREPGRGEGRECNDRSEEHTSEL